ncbi:hypothetical protein ACQPZQ_18750 [Pseudonocardia sp. CA-142604]
MTIDDRPRPRQQAGNPLPQIGIPTIPVPHIDLTSYGARSST